jgi:hypothetical protein
MNGTVTDALDKARTYSETLLFASGKKTAGSLSKCIFDDAFLPSEIDRLHLAAAAAFLFCGSPVQIHNAAMHLLLMNQIELLNKLASPETCERYRAEYGNGADQRLDEHRHAILEGNVRVDVGRENWKQLGFESFHLERMVIDELRGMHMTIVTCPPDSFFVTSDNPVVRTFPSKHDKSDDELWFPISFKRGILWHRMRNMPRKGLGFSETRSLNRRLIKFAFRRVFSPLPQNWVEAATREENFYPTLGHYESLSKVADSSERVIDSAGNDREIVDLIGAMRAGPRFDVVGL